MPHAIGAAKLRAQCSRPCQHPTNRRLYRPARIQNATSSRGAMRRLCCSAAQQVTAEGACQDDIYEWLTDRVLSSAHHSTRCIGGPQQRHMVGIGGPPGSGKSTAAAEIARRVNDRRGAASGAGAASSTAIAVPMDGFHYYRRELDAMPDPAMLHARRGAHWTFNAPAFVTAMQRVRNSPEAALPSFEHGVGDPVEDDILITANHTVVLVEGNYLLIDEPPWGQLAALFDDTWYVDTDIDVAMRRVYNRQVKDGREPGAVRGRIDGNDRPNAVFIEESSRQRAAVIVPGERAWTKQLNQAKRSE